MTQKNGSSYLPIAYLLAVTISLVLIHMGDRMSSHYHQAQIKNIDKIKRKVQPINKTNTVKPNRKNNAQKVRSDTLIASVKKEQVSIDTVMEEVKVTSDSGFFRALISSYQSELEVSKGSQSRTDVIIRYYKKDKDPDDVYDLRKLGFYIHERPADNEFDEYPSNSIFYGDAVSKRDIIVVAHKLISSGFKIQNISLSKFHDTWKAHSIEIGTDTTSLKKPSFTLATLRKKWESM